jgi:hypothetical protein
LFLNLFKTQQNAKKKTTFLAGEYDPIKVKRNRKARRKAKIKHPRKHSIMRVFFFQGLKNILTRAGFQL